MDEDSYVREERLRELEERLRGFAAAEVTAEEAAEVIEDWLRLRWLARNRDLFGR